MVALSDPGTSVGHERKGYARGLILGLTMAETMLLLVFCFLLLAGAIIAKKQKELEAAIERSSQNKTELQRLRQDNKNLVAQVREMMEQATGHKVPDEEWRKLVLAKDAVDQIERSGLLIEDAVKMAETTIAIRDHDLKVEDIEKLLSVEKRAVEAEAKLSQAETELRETTRQPKDLPPIINLSEAEGYSFEVGSAELKPDFKSRLKGGIAEQIQQIVKKYDVDVVEIIGHTDEQRLSRQSNMDSEVGRVLTGQDGVSKMEPGDNAGLGLARAISVTTALKNIPTFSGLSILPMSGGQLILPDDRLTDGAQSGDAPSRRRIEIRVRKSKHKLGAESKL